MILMSMRMKWKTIVNQEIHLHEIIVIIQILVIQIVQVVQVLNSSKSCSMSSTYNPMTQINGGDGFSRIMNHQKYRLLIHEAMDVTEIMEVISMMEIYSVHQQQKQEKY